MKQIILAITIMAASFNAVALEFKKNVPPAIKQQMTDDLAFMAGINGQSQTPFHQEIFGKVDGDTFRNFFTSRVKSVGMDGCGNGAAVACVQPYFYPNTMWLTENFVKFSHPQVARMMIVYHEARHTESKGRFWMHANCPVPFRDQAGKDKVSIWTGSKLEGEPACDSDYRGSYGSSAILLKNIGKYCSNCTGKVKMDADLYAMDQLERITSNTVKQKILNDFATP